MMPLKTVTPSSTSSRAPVVGVNPLTTRSKRCKITTIKLETKAADAAKTRNLKRVTAVQFTTSNKSRERRIIKISNSAAVVEDLKAEVDR